jgi:uncharacterized protein (TIGR02452 family)
MELRPGAASAEMMPPLMDRPRAAALGHEAVRILEAGFYTSPSGERIDLQAALGRARPATVAYAPDEDLSWPTSDRCNTEIEIVKATTLAAAARLVNEGRQPGVLNFAISHDGGRRIPHRGASARGVARAILGLVACLDRQVMYAFHRTEEGNRQGVVTEKSGLVAGVDVAADRRYASRR